MAVSILVQYDFDPTPYPSSAVASTGEPPFGYAFGTLRERQSPTAGNPPAGLSHRTALLSASEEGKILPPLCLAERRLGVRFPLYENQVTTTINFTLVSGYGGFHFGAVRF
ncbi:hypothetical protein [Scytonema sp. PRP1]|uniref:hypothetical protein n=1 Tax=Scytonema sp. PRP1 TaxID=3120513 RepID=UPI00300D88E1